MGHEGIGLQGYTSRVGYSKLSEQEPSSCLGYIGRSRHYR